MTTINELAEAVKSVIVLKDTVAKHEMLVEAILDKLEQIQERLSALERPTPRTRR